MIRRGMSKNTFLLLPLIPLGFGACLSLIKFLRSYLFQQSLQKSLSHFFYRAAIATIVVSAVFILTQDIQVFPGTIGSLLGNPPIAPKDVEEILLPTHDGERIVVWRVEATTPKRKQVVFILHGNAETVANALYVQRWLQSLGFTSYALDYRGFGKSSGWPSERGIYIDADATIKLILRREQIIPTNLIVLGNSIGAGPAAYVAAKYKSGTLVLIAPYTSLTNVVSEIPLLGYLSPFLWTSFPTKEFIGKLSDTCVVAAHGRNDSTIPYHHSLELKNSYKGARSYVLLSSDVAGHNDIFASVYENVGKAIDDCLKGNNTYSKGESP